MFNRFIRVNSTLSKNDSFTYRTLQVKSISARVVSDDTVHIFHDCDSSVTACIPPRRLTVVCVEYRVCDAAFHPPTLAPPSTKVKLRLFWRPCAWGDSLYPVWCVCVFSRGWLGQKWPTAGQTPTPVSNCKHVDRSAVLHWSFSARARLGAWYSLRARLVDFKGIKVFY